MTSRKAVFKDDERANKRQRILDTNEHVPGSFDALNNDCVLYIASFLPIDDANTFGTIDRRCRGIRRHESLDQTRIATITCSRARGSYSRSLRETLNAARRVLSSNYTHLKIVGLEVVEDERFERDRIPVATLPHVTKLELLSSNLNERSNNNGIAPKPLILLPHCLPNISEMALNSVKIEGSIVDTRNFFDGFAHLEKVHHVGHGVGNHLTGYEYRARTLVLDDCCLHFFVDDPMSIDEKSHLLEQFSHNDYGHVVTFLLMHCRHLQRLSIKGATWYLLSYDESIRSNPEPIPQEMIIKMVRRCPTLRWLRSDLSEENVAMLQRERPGITFVS